MKIFLGVFGALLVIVAGITYSFSDFHATILVVLAAIYCQLVSMDIE